MEPDGKAEELYGLGKNRRNKLCLLVYGVKLYAKHERQRWVRVTHPTVSQFETKHGYGLYEVGGNLREWVWDWEDARSYAYDFNESFPDENGSLKLVDDVNSTAFFVPEVKGFQPFFGNTHSAAEVYINQGNSNNWYLIKTIDLSRAMTWN